MLVLSTYSGSNPGLKFSDFSTFFKILAIYKCLQLFGQTFLNIGLFANKSRGSNVCLGIKLDPAPLRKWTLKIAFSFCKFCFNVHIKTLQDYDNKI